MAVIETAVMDNLIASNEHPLTGQTCTVLSGAGALKRGSVLMRNSDGKYVLAAASAGTAELILAADVDATDTDAVAEAYNSGQFNKNALIVADSYELTAQDIADLKDAGIYIETSVTI